MNILNLLHVPKRSVSKLDKYQPAFTIVELLVVIVVIGILAAITIVSYTGISQSAIKATLLSDLSSASKELKLFQVINDNYPQTIRCDAVDSNINKCLKSSPGNSFDYSYNNSSNPETFTLDATNTNSYTYRVTDNSDPGPTTDITAIAAITGTKAVGSVLTAGAITPAAATISYQWQNATTSGGTYSDIAGAIWSAYIPVIGDLGKFIKLEVTGIGDYHGVKLSSATTVITTPFTAIAAITGTTTVGSLLTAGARTPAAATVSYQWQNATITTGPYSNIAGATAASYTLVIGDQTKFIKVVATGTGSYTGTITSAATTVIN